MFSGIFFAICLTIQSGGTVTLDVKQDDLIEGTEAAVFTLQGLTSYTVSGEATWNTDYTVSPHTPQGGNLFNVKIQAGQESAR